MENYIDDNRVAVLYSPGYGSGWYTWSTKYPELMFDVRAVKYVLSHSRCESRTELIAYLEERCPNIYIGSNFDDLEICWVDQGEEFRIHEYDGSEMVITCSCDEPWHVA